MATRVIVSGRVQGVGFRWSAAREAQRLGVTGSIRNLPDGRVEAVVDDGTGAAELIDWLRHGPPGAEVTGVETAPADDTGSGGFDILPS
jgi:acylphosphatase